MGKSTISKWICLKTIEQNLAIPILIELRNLNENHSALDEIFEQLNPIDQVFDEDLIIKFLELGQFLIIFDGFDEIQNDHQAFIIKDIKNFISKTIDNIFIITSRPEGTLAAFGDFQLFKINPLIPEEAYDLIYKYDAVSPVKVGKNLIRDIETKLTQVQELLGNPFLISLLYSVYAYNKEIPDDKVTFYEEIYSALYKKHDLSKGGWSRPKSLNYLPFKILLRRLAFDTARRGEVIYSESEIINYIQKAVSKCPGIIADPKIFLDDLLTSVPLFKQDGHKVRWGHKSIQDFFASDFINNSSSKEEILEWIIDNNRDDFINVLDFFIEQDFITFRKTIIYRILKDFVHHYENSYNDIKAIKQEDINERRTITFDLDIVCLHKNQNTTFPAFELFAERMIPGYKEGVKRGIVMPPYKGVYYMAISTIYSTILNKFAHKIPYNNYIKFNNEFGYKYSTSKEITFPSNDIYMINDNPKSFFNNYQNFKNVNLFIGIIGFYKSFHLSYMDAKKELEKIDYEISLSKNVSNLKDF